VHDGFIDVSSEMVKHHPHPPSLAGRLSEQAAPSEAARGSNMNDMQLCQRYSL